MISLHKKAGYTHRIFWEENVKNIGTVTKSFPTTKDAVPLHLYNMKKSPDKIFNIRVELFREGE